MAKRSSSSVISEQKQAFRKRLKQLGFKTYSEYLEGKHWKAFRSKWYRKFGSFKCSVCGDTEEVHLHHWTYVRLGKERLQDVYPLCRIDHDRVHEWCEENKTPLDSHDKIFGVLFSADPPPWITETPKKTTTKQSKSETINPDELNVKVRAYQCLKCKMIYRTIPTKNQVTPCCGTNPRRINNNASVDCEFILPSKPASAKQISKKEHKPKAAKENPYKCGRCEVCGIPLQHKGLTKCCKCFNRKFFTNKMGVDEEPKTTRFDLAVKAKRRKWQSQLKAKQDRERNQ